MADQDSYRVRLGMALATRAPIAAYLDIIEAVRDDELHAARTAIAAVRQLCEEAKTDQDAPGLWLLAEKILAALDGPDLREVTVSARDLDLVMNHAGDPAHIADYPAAAQRVRDALEGAQRA
ncbi:hypothetical protein MF672_038920 [Actinomadura sp. ATCC 31491]|uniref:Uncharacterized protein n=1 Tax=Actinomadura luzonensis TaxID=2805427 RepID=A0ABT0G571_9ACTN|nr:hypothetical protein [Actinomadura luzonensis]MCK2219727.1 hypothetical protein [Actinomadura luzonensis]